MATNFSKIYERAIFRFADYDFLTYDVQTRESILEKYLMSAKTDFQRICRVDLTDYDINLKQFNRDLDDEIIEILSLGVAYYWVSYKSLNSELLKNVLCSKDYYTYSPANLLKEVQTLRDSLRNEFQGRIRKYSYYDNTLEDLKA